MTGRTTSRTGAPVSQTTLISFAFLEVQSDVWICSRVIALGSELPHCSSPSASMVPSFWPKNLLAQIKKQRSAPGPPGDFCQQQLADFPLYFLFLFLSLPFLLIISFYDSLVFSFLFLSYLLFFRFFRLLFTVKITACATNI